MEQVEGFRDDTAGSAGYHLQDTTIKVDVWGRGEGVAPIIMSISTEVSQS
jgi:hypothetical protein